jgi:hypothetical protein
MSQDQSADARQEYEYVYHWDRILGAVIALAVVVAGAAWLFSGDSDAGPTAGTTTGSNGAAAQVTPLPSPIAPATPAGSETPAGVPAQTPAVTAADNQTTRPSTTGNAVTSPSATSPTPTTVAAATSAGDAVRSNESQTEGAATGGIAASENLRQGEARVIAGDISEVSLKQVIDQELIAISKGLIDVGQRKAVRLVFSARFPSAGDPVSFSWFHEGRQVVTVKTRVSPEGVATGSKYVSFDTPGDWQVKLSDARGQLLAEAAVRARRR